MLSRLKLFLNPFKDGRYEDLFRGNVPLNIFRDFTAGLVVALVAIPLAMGFAMASGLRPEQGIVGGAVAGLVGALFGGSKYQVYGPTAAFIPVIAAVMATQDHGFLVLASILAGVVLALSGLFGLGRYVNMVPHSIVVGFTIGIAVTIAMSQIGEVLGLAKAMPGTFVGKARTIVEEWGTLNIWAIVFALGTFALTKGLQKVSVFVPAPLVSLGVFTLLAATVLDDVGLALVSTKYGSIPAESWVFTPPRLGPLDGAAVGQLAYAVLAIVLVSAIESLLCSRMADRLANNTGTPFHPNKELWGQGMVNMLVVLVNGFPHTGALARTATNIKVGAVSPLAGIFKAVLKLAIAFYLARWLELVPMACIAGILLYVASNMVKPSEVDEVKHMGTGHVRLMLFTAVLVIVTDFLTGVLSALVLYGAWQLLAAGLKGAGATANVTAHGTGHDGAVAVPSGRPAHLRAVLGDERALARRLDHQTPGSGGNASWLKHITRPARVAPTAYVHPQAAVIGDVVLADDVHVAAGASVRADEGTPFFIGRHSNVQDGVILHALKDRTVSVGGEEWAIYVGRNVSMAHGAIVHGPCYIGDDTFIGFRATVHDSVVGARCAIGHSAVVVGVEIPDGKLVPNGAIIDSADKVARLPEATEKHRHFNEDVVEVNRGLAAAYHAAAGPAPQQVPSSFFVPSPSLARDRF